MPAVFVSGTGTDVGKTVVAAWMCLHWKARYWKPVQAGRYPETDTQWVQRVTCLPDEQFIPEAFCLEMAASPHVAAAAEGVLITQESLAMPSFHHNLVVEGAGGLMVPLSDELLSIDWCAAHRMPVVLVVHTVLGCINHALLSLEALRHRGIPLAGIVFNDGGRPESEAVILARAQAPLLGRLPRLSAVSGAALLAIPMLAEPLI